MYEFFKLNRPNLHFTLTKVNNFISDDMVHQPLTHPRIKLAVSLGTLLCVFWLPPFV